MKSLLKDLFHGKVYPNEQTRPINKQYHPLNLKISDELCHFQESLAKDEYTRLEDLFSLHSQSSLMESEECFAYGFKLATVIMVETYMSIEKLSR